MDNNKNRLKTELIIDEEIKGRWLSNLRYFWLLLWKDKTGLLGLLIFLTVVFAAIFAPVISPYDPLRQALEEGKAPPAWAEKGNPQHLLGTDSLGRDILSRIIYGTRVSLTVGFFGVLIASSLGILIGLISGYIGGRTDNIIMTFVNMILALPYLVFVVFIAAILGRSLINVIMIFGFTDIPIFVRVTRGEVLRMREQGFIEAAKSIGAKTSRILFKQIMPNLLGPLITLATFEMSAMIFYEAGLGFLGLSVPPTTPSWGNMLALGRNFLTIYPWMSIFPGLAIAFTGLGMNLLGDWLRDVLDPRMRRAKK